MSGIAERPRCVLGVLAAAICCYGGTACGVEVTVISTPNDDPPKPGARPVEPPQDLAFWVVPREITLGGSPAGGTLTLGMVMLADNAREVTVSTAQGDTIPAITARLNSAVNAADIGFETHVKEGDPNTLVLDAGPRDHSVFMRATDAGLNVPAAVTGLTATLDKPNNTCSLAWSAPAGTTYDAIFIRKGLIRGSRLTGSATSFVDRRVRTLSDQAWDRMVLEYTVIAAKDGVPSDFAKVTVLNAFRVETLELPNGQAGLPYEASLAAAGDGVPPFTWALDPGASLPPGLALSSSTGAISGTPSQPGTYAFGINVTDSQSPPSTAGSVFEMVILP